MGFGSSAGFAAVRSRLVTRVPKCRTSYVYSLAHMLIPVTFTHADSPPSPPAPPPLYSPLPLSKPLLVALCRPQLRCLPFSSGSKRARAPNGIQSPGGWLPLAGFKRGGEGRGCPHPRRGRFRLLKITDGDLSHSQKWRGRWRRITQPHMSMRQMKGNGERRHGV